MNFLLLLVGVAIAGGFAVAALVRRHRTACGLDAVLMTGLMVAACLAAFVPTVLEQLLGRDAVWGDGGPPDGLKIVAAASIVAAVFSVRTAIVGEASLLFGATGVWGLVALVAVSPQAVDMYLMLQMSTWLAWVEVNRRDESSKTMAGTRWLLWTIAADLPLGLAIIQVVGNTAGLPWTVLQGIANDGVLDGGESASLSMLVIGLVCSAAVRLAQFPLSTWLPGVVETGRVGRGFASSLMSIPLGLILLERAADLWTLSPTAELMVQSWGPLATIAIAVATFGQVRPVSVLALATASLLGVVLSGSAMAGVVSWPAVLLCVAAVRPAWTTVGRTLCGSAFGLMFLVAVVQERSSGQVHALFEASCLAALVAAGRATWLNRFDETTSDERTHPLWPAVMLLSLAVLVLWDDAVLNGPMVSGPMTDEPRAGGDAGLWALLTAVGIDRLIAAAAAFGVGVVSARMWTARDDGDGGALNRLARRQFYIDDVIAFTLVLPTRATAQAVRLVDWSTTRTAVLAACSGVMRRLDRESTSADDPPGHDESTDHDQTTFPQATVAGLIAGTLALVLLMLTGEL